MSIQNKTRRVQRLETRSGANQTVAAIVRRIVEPSPNGPQATGEGYARILKGSHAGTMLEKLESESWQQFQERVEAVL